MEPTKVVPSWLWMDGPSTNSSGWLWLLFVPGSRHRSQGCQVFEKLKWPTQQTLKDSSTVNQKVNKFRFKNSNEPPTSLEKWAINVFALANFIANMDPRISVHDQKWLKHGIPGSPFFVCEMMCTSTCSLKYEPAHSSNCTNNKCRTGAEAFFSASHATSNCRKGLLVDTDGYLLQYSDDFWHLSDTHVLTKVKYSRLHIRIRGIFGLQEFFSRNSIFM